MSKNNGFALFPLFILAASGCEKTVEMTGTAQAPKSGQVLAEPEKVIAVFERKPETDLINDDPGWNEFTVRFVKDFTTMEAAATIPSNISLAAYKNADCSVLGDGALTYDVLTESDLVTITNVKYSKNVDVYLKVSADDAVPICSDLVHFMSETPFYFEVIDLIETNGMIGTVGEKMKYPLQFKIYGVTDSPVENARVSINGQEGTGSGADGISSLYLTLGTEAMDYSGFTDAFIPYAATLKYRGDTFQESAIRRLFVAPGLAEKIIPFSEPGFFTTYIEIMMADKYENLIYPTEFKFKEISVYNDNKCLIETNDEVYFAGYESNLWTEPNVPSSYFESLIMVHEGAGTYYLKVSFISYDIFHERSKNISDCIGPLVFLE